MVIGLATPALPLHVHQKLGFGTFAVGLVSGSQFAAAMVSRIPYPHVVNQLFNGQRSFGHLITLIFSALAVVLVRGYAVPIVCVAFVLSGPVRYVWQEAVERRPHKEPIF